MRWIGWASLLVLASSAIALFAGATIWLLLLFSPSAVGVAYGLSRQT